MQLKGKKGEAASVCQFLEQTDAMEVVQMQTEQDEPSDDFKRKVAKWEAAGVFDKMATKVDQMLEKE